MAHERKIRNLVEQDNISTSLNDIIDACIEASYPLRDLEFGNKKTHLSKAKNNMLKVKNLVIDLKRRLDGEITNEVHLDAKTKNVNYKGNSSYFKKK